MLSSTSANPSLFSKGPPGWGLVLVQSHPLPPVLPLRADTESPGLNLQKLTFTSLGLAQASSSVGSSVLPPETTPVTPAHPPRWRLLPPGASPGSLDLSPPSFPDEPPLTLDLQQLPLPGTPSPAPTPVAHPRVPGGPAHSSPGPSLSSCSFLSGQKPPTNDKMKPLITCDNSALLVC